MADNIVQIIIEAKDLASNVIGKTQKSLDDFSQKTEAFSNKLRGFAGDIGGFGAAIAGLGATLSAGALTKSFIDINASTEKTKILLTELMGSTQKADGAFRWLQAQTTQMPFSIDAMKDSFVKLKVAGLDPMSGTMQTLVDAIAAFGGTDQDLNLASVAIQQMASKGVISMEELRQQLGERIPTAMKAMAKGLGYSTEDLREFFKAVESGSVSAQKGLDAMFQELSRQHKGMAAKMMDSWGGMIATLKSAWQQMMIALGETGAFEKIKNAVQRVIEQLERMKQSGELQKWIDSASRMISSLISTFQNLFDVMAAVFNVIGPHLPVLAEWLIYLGALKVALNVAAGAVALLGNTMTIVFAAFAVGWHIGKWISDLDAFGMKISDWTLVVIANYDILFTRLQIGWQTVKKYMTEALTLGFADTSGIDKHIAALHKELDIARQVKDEVLKKRDAQAESNKASDAASTSLGAASAAMGKLSTDTQSASSALGEYKKTVDSTSTSLNKMSSIEVRLGINKEELKTLNTLLGEYVDNLKSAYQSDQISHQEYINRKKASINSYYEAAIAHQKEQLAAAGDDLQKRAAAEAELFRIMSQYRKDMRGLEEEYYKWLLDKEKEKLGDAEMSAEARKKLEKDVRETVQKELGKTEQTYTKLYKTIDEEGNEVWKNMSDGSEKASKALATTFEAFVEGAKEQTDILDASINKDRKIQIENREALAAIERVQAAIDAIPDVTVKKVRMEIEGSGSSVKPIMEKLEEVKQGFHKIPKERDFTINFRGSTGGDRQAAQSFGDAIRSVADNLGASVEKAKLDLEIEKLRDSLLELEKTYTSWMTRTYKIDPEYHKREAKKLSDQIDYIKRQIEILELQKSLAQAEVQQTGKNEGVSGASGAAAGVSGGVENWPHKAQDALIRFQGYALQLPESFNNAAGNIFAALQNNMNTAMDSIKRVVPDMFLEGGQLTTDVKIQKDLSIHNTFELRTFDEATTRRWVRDVVFPEFDRNMKLKGVIL